MCGIVGQVSLKEKCIPEKLRVMRDTLSHRGPDDYGEWYSPDLRVGFAHRRLSVIDLTQGGHQPMVDSTGKFVITFNGEIYNYQDLRSELRSKGYIFYTESDTEVILAAYREWGIESLKHLNGMFAFAIFDSQEHRVFIARDRAGEKPFFYRFSGGSLFFASELKALMADPDFSRQIDLESLNSYLSFGYVPGDSCILRGVNKLSAAHAASYDLNTGNFEVWRYWQLPDFSGISKKPVKQDEDALLGELEDLLADSVRRQLVANVPVGILLSGGVDSSLITAMAVRASRNVRTFTIRFSGYGRFDETKHARLIAQHFSTEHIELEAEPSTLELLPKLAEQFDEPIVDSSMIPTYLVSKLARQHCTVAIGGDGGDELFGGYGYYNRLLRLMRQTDALPIKIRQLLSVSLSKILPNDFRGRNWLNALRTDYKRSVPQIVQYFDFEYRKKIIANKEYLRSAEKVWTDRVPKGASLLERALSMDFQNFLAEDLLVKVDRASMLNSLEVRSPWLDYRIVEFAFGKVSPELKVSLRNRKILPKKLAGKLLPSEFDLERKQGFSIPLASWLRGVEWGGYFRDVLLSSNSGIFKGGEVNKLLKRQVPGHINSERLFALVLFELWRSKYKINF